MRLLCFRARCPHPLASLVRERRLATEEWMHQGKPHIRRCRKQHMCRPWFWIMIINRKPLFLLTLNVTITLELLIVRDKKRGCVFLWPQFCLPPSQTTSSALKGAIQLGIGYTVGNLSSKPERDVLMQDFYVVESIFFPRCVIQASVLSKQQCSYCKYILWSRSLFWLIVL